MATYAFWADDTRFAVLSERDSLVSAVLAGDKATSATDTFLAVNLGEDHRLAVEVVRKNNIRKLFAYEFLQFRYSAFRHIVLQAEDQVIDDAVTVLHDGGADLHIAATELDELQRIAPGLDAAYTTYIHVLLDSGFM